VQSLVCLDVVDVADPLPDQLLKLGDVVERALLDVLAPVGDVRALVAGQLVQQR